jgi:hypothetical protein
MSDFEFLEGPIPDTIYRCVIDGHEVTAIYHSGHRQDAEDDGEGDVSPWMFELKALDIECKDAATKEKILAAWKHEWEIDEEEIRAGRRAEYSTQEGVLLGMLENMAGGEDKVEVVQEPELWRYGIIL